MKSFTVTAFFPGVKPAHCAWQTVQVHASSVVVAASRALHILRSRQGIARKRVRKVQLTIREAVVVTLETMIRK